MAVFRPGGVSSSFFLLLNIIKTLRFPRFFSAPNWASSMKFCTHILNNIPQNTFEGFCETPTPPQGSNFSEFWIFAKTWYWSTFCYQNRKKLKYRTFQTLCTHPPPLFPPAQMGSFWTSRPISMKFSMYRPWVFMNGMEPKKFDHPPFPPPHPPPPPKWGFLNQ